MDGFGVEEEQRGGWCTTRDYNADGRCGTAYGLLCRTLCAAASDGPVRPYMVAYGSFLCANVWESYTICCYVTVIEENQNPICNHMTITSAAR